MKFKKQVLSLDSTHGSDLAKSFMYRVRCSTAGAYTNHMERTRRRRREVSASTIRGLSALFRYSASRDAYVLRGIGNWLGPVLKCRI
jgi:hypothetical protein